MRLFKTDLEALEDGVIAITPMSGSLKIGVDRLINAVTETYWHEIIEKRK